jgi:hypothetical protein
MAFDQMEYLKIIYFQALGYVKLDIFCGYSLPFLSHPCDQVLNTVVLRLCLIFICICARVCVCTRACLYMCAHTNTIHSKK